MYYLKNDDDNKERKEETIFFIAIVIFILIGICCMIVTTHVLIEQNNKRKQEVFNNPPTVEIVKSDFGNSFFIGDDLLNDYISVVKYNNSNFRDAAIYFIIDNRPFLKETRYYQAIYLVHEFNTDLPIHKFYEWKNADKYIQMTEEEYNYYTQTNKQTKQNDEEK